jgi:uncharacterized protein YigE (DUF2233 family)
MGGAQSQRRVTGRKMAAKAAAGAGPRRLLILLGALAACGADPLHDEGESAASTIGPSRPAACAVRQFEGSRFTICPFNSNSDRLELVEGSTLRSLAALEAALGPQGRQVKFAMNAGMYDEDGRPIGLFVADGRTRKALNLRKGSGNFHLLPNGVLAQDREGRVFVTTSGEFARTVPSPRWATQSGPMLVVDGKLHPKFDENGTSQLIRNGVGVAGPETAYFAISEDVVSFGRFARLFRDALGCRNALYLDGSVSSLWDPGAGRQDAYSELGPMLVVFDGNDEAS